jgi:glucosamine--fructose-6-phosphate aminotransferase (isomerizing)
MTQTVSVFKTLFEIGRRARRLLPAGVYWGRPLHRVPAGALVVFPVQTCLLGCGLAGIVALKRPPRVPAEDLDLALLAQLTETLEKAADGQIGPLTDPAPSGPGDGQTVDALWRAAEGLKQGARFYALFTDPVALAQLDSLTGRLSAVAGRASRQFAEQVGRLPAATVEAAAARLERLKDAVWCLGTEVADNVRRVQTLLQNAPARPSAETVAVFKNINAVLNSVDRLEVRGRDSAGISLLFVLERADYEEFSARLNSAPGLAEELARRRSGDVLVNRSIGIAEGDDGRVCLSLVYKVAAEIGSLGDNIRFLRRQIEGDAILQLLAGFPNSYHTVSAHTRWASIGAISEPNCHPVDNDPNAACPGRRGIIHACLNGDIDNYLALRARYEQNGHRIHADVTTDTKIIPLHVEGYIQQGFDVETAFRKAVSDFEGSHAISMHTDLAPGKLFLAQRGSGQAVFIGLADTHYMPTSEVYGFVEETRRFVKIDGEKVVQGAAGKTQGQVFVLDQASAGGLAGIRAMYYDGTPIELGEGDVRQTEITSRDIDRQGFAHYFLKEISESPELAAKTLRNRWQVVRRDGGEMLAVTLDEKTFPARLRAAFTAGEIRKVYFVGQGTAGVAALACADILNYYLDGSPLQIAGMRASELSGFKLQAAGPKGTMGDTLVVAISQSGTTTDTNRAVDMVKERGARTLGIVNRRDSDLTFKVEGVIYPSSGRDIEMSVASTKAFYSQVVAGAVLGLFIARIQGHRSEAFVSDEIRQWLRLPDQMRQVLALQPLIEASARRHAVTRTYWAAVGSGPNKTAADEIRIKLSELCYKTISSDCIEDKKHIDLSSEPLIIVSAAGVSPTVLGDIIKDTAIFKAHKATPIVIADEGQHGFDPYAVDVFHVPAVSPHLAPILNVMAGHIWGYCAALAINEGSRFFFEAREDIQRLLNNFAQDGLDVYEVILEKAFRERIQQHYVAFKGLRDQQRLVTALPLDLAADLTLLFKYLAGRLPVADFELDFGIKGTARNMLDRFFTCLGDAINAMARPVDAIKHQAKTVTVGTSRIGEKTEGILFDTLALYGIGVDQVSNRNIIVLRNLQAVVDEIKGAILYRIGGLNLLGEPTDESTIEILVKAGILEPIPSRVETDRHLKGTKRIIVAQGNVYIGKGRKDGRSIIIIPVISTAPATPNLIENLLLLNIGFRQEIPLTDKIRALGGKYDHIKNIVQENSIAWEDRYLELVATEDLFGNSAEKIGEYIVSRLK